MGIIQSDPVLMFDGHCHLCSGLVQFILRNDQKGRIRMAALQSPAGIALLTSYGIGSQPADSMVLLKDGKYWLESDAALRLAAELGGWWKISLVFWIIPRFLRNRMYRFVARNRYRIWGKSEQCFLPRPEWNNRFLTIENN